MSANKQKFAEKDREVADWREQISGVASNTSIQPNNSTLSDVSQMQPGKSGNSAASEPCSSNSSGMIESVEIGFPHGMNGNVLNGNVCSMTRVNMSVPTNGSQILPELSLLTLSSQEHNTVHFLKDLDEYLKLKSGNKHMNLTLVSKSLTEEFAKK